MENQRVYYNKTPIKDNLYQETILIKSNNKDFLIESDTKRFGIVSCPSEAGVFHRFPDNRMNIISGYMQQHKIKPIEPSEFYSRRNIARLVLTLSKTEDGDVIPSALVRATLTSLNIS